MPTTAPDLLDFADIQGNVLTAYGKQGFPKGCFVLLNIRDAAKGRALIEALLPRVTSALRWPSAKAIPTGAIVPERPLVALNLAFTFLGLLAVRTPVRTLRGLPDEFIDGMNARACILGDDTPADALQSWDPVWRSDPDPKTKVHLLITLNARMDPTSGAAVPQMEQTVTWIKALCDASGGGVAVLRGHGRSGADDRQDLSAIIRPRPDGRLAPLPIEHFGFTDGVGDPVFAGQYPAQAQAVRVIGNGALTGQGEWRPLATGEFLLGYPDEAQEIAGAAMPLPFSRNGTFFAYRKLQENVVAFRTYIAASTAKFGAVFAIDDPTAARETLLAKISGRWSDGVPISLAPNFAAWQAFDQRLALEGDRPRTLSNFTYHDDPAGLKCPVTAHMRRANPRDGLDPLDGPGLKRAPSGSVLNNRRRILRRGLPYGAAAPDATSEGEHGLVFMAACASLTRQFEFVQQQWMNYGLDFNAGNDTCPLVGTRGEGAKFVIAADPAAGHAPFILDKPPQFVETRGGAYFFTPSLTALRMLAMGVIDPT